MRILLVEDEHGMARFIKKGLEEEGYRVDLGVDGGEGLALALSNTYDLIVLDLMLPGMNGLLVCRELRDKRVHTPVLMLTALDTVGDKVKGLDSGADDYLTKPFSFEELLARARALVRRKKSEIEELACGLLKMDLAARRVTMAEAEVQLRPKEYAILLYLLRNKGRVVSRTQILENVWGYDVPDTNVVEAHIKALRHKLAEACPEKKFIRSIRGAGYILGGEA